MNYLIDTKTVINKGEHLFHSRVESEQYEVIFGDGYLESS